MRDEESSLGSQTGRINCHA